MAYVSVGDAPCFGQGVMRFDSSVSRDRMVQEKHAVIAETGVRVIHRSPYALLAQLDRALRYGRRDCGFKSCIMHHICQWRNGRRTGLRDRFFAESVSSSLTWHTICCR